LLLLAPNQGNNGTVEFTWRGLELIVGNYYVITLLVFIAAAACALVLTRRLRPERAAPTFWIDERGSGDIVLRNPGVDPAVTGEPPGRTGISLGRTGRVQPVNGPPVAPRPIRPQND
jgi:hypothetical protein